VEEYGRQKSALDKEIRELVRKKVSLSSEIGGKEEILIRLGEIGFSDEDLLRLRAFLETTGKGKTKNPAEVREKFFVALGTYKNIRGLEQEKETYARGIRELTREKSLLTGEIKELEKKKGTLLGEMNKDIIDTLLQLKSVGESAVIEIQQQVNDIQQQFDSLLVDALKTGQAIGVMRQMANKGKEAEKSFEDFVKDLQTRTGVRND